MYSVKTVLHRGVEARIVCQSGNGPCPLLALCNALSLRGQLQLPPQQDWVDGGSLTAALRARLLAAHGEQPPNANRDAMLVTALEQLPGLERGLDVNLRFADVESFESTPQLALFDAAALRLLHGWCVDPQERAAAAALGSLSFNQAAERAIAVTAPAGAGEPDLLSFSPDASEQLDGGPAGGAAASAGDLLDAQLIRAWLEQHSSQLTVFGLACVHERLRENELAVFFRADHFSTVIKHTDGRVYALVTDVGYAQYPGVVWERLDDTMNDTTLCDAHMRPVEALEKSSPRSAGAPGVPAFVAGARHSASTSPRSPSGCPDDANAAPRAQAGYTMAARPAAAAAHPDYALALALHEEELARVRAGPGHPGDQPGAWGALAGAAASGAHARSSEYGSGAVSPSGPPPPPRSIAGRHNAYMAQAATHRGLAAEREARQAAARAAGGHTAHAAGVDAARVGGQSASRHVPGPPGDGGAAAAPGRGGRNAAAARASASPGCVLM